MTMKMDEYSNEAGYGDDAPLGQEPLHPDDRPTRSYIEALASWAGGSLNHVPYSASNMTDVATTGEKAPSVDSIVSGVWGAFWGRIAREMKYLRLEFSEEVRGDGRVVYLPENWEVRVPSTGPDKVHQSLGQIFVGDPSITMAGPSRPGLSQSKRDKRDNLITRMLENLSQLEEQQSDSSPLNYIKTNCLPLGLSVRSVALDPDWLGKWGEEPTPHADESDDDFQDRLAAFRETRRNTSPIKPFSIHPSNICYDRAHTPMQWALIREPIDPHVAAKAYPNWRGGRMAGNEVPGQSAGYLCMARYWDDNYTAVFIDGEPALGPEDNADEDGIAPNPYGFIPCWPAAGGHGYQDPKGRPEYELRGMLADHLDLLREDAYCENLEQIYMKRLTYGPKNAIMGGPEDPREQKILAEKMSSGPEETVFLPAEAKREALSAEPIPDWLVQRRRRLDQRIDTALGYNVQYGSADPAEAAVRSKFRAAQAEKRYADAVLHMQQAEEGYYRGVLHIIKHVLKRPIDVNVSIPDQGTAWEVLRPEDIPDNPQITVKLTGDTEEDKARRQAEDDARLSAPIPTLDLAEYLVRRGEHDVEGRIAAIESDKLYAAAYAPALALLAQKGAAAVIAAELASRGVMLSVDDIAREYQSLISEGQNQGAGSPPVPGQPGGAELQINGAGPALPGTSTSDQESSVSDNPIATRPSSPEATSQRTNLAARSRLSQSGLDGRSPGGQRLLQSIPGYIPGLA